MPFTIVAPLGHHFCFLKKWHLVFNLIICINLVLDMKKKFMQLVSSFVIKKANPSSWIHTDHTVDKMSCQSLQTHPNTSLLAAIRIKFRVGEFGPGRLSLTTSSKVGRES